MLFLGVVLLSAGAVTLLVHRPITSFRPLAAYLIGVSAMYWLVERLAAFAI